MKISIAARLQILLILLHAAQHYALEHCATLTLR